MTCMFTKSTKNQVKFPEMMERDLFIFSANHGFRFDVDFYERLKHKKEKINLLSIFVSVFPILEWLPEYKWHTDLFHDIVAGLTVAIMHIPQGNIR